LIAPKQGFYGVFMTFIYRVGLPLLGVILFFSIASNYYRLAFNTTESLAGSVYLIDKNALPERGDIAAFIPPHGNINTNQKGYLSTSSFLKETIGVSGDEVIITDTDVFVNAQHLGPIYSEGSNGQVLIPTKSGIVPIKHYFMGTKHHGSYDSRYASIGYISEDLIIGRAIRLF